MASAVQRPEVGAPAARAPSPGSRPETLRAPALTVPVLRRIEAADRAVVQVGDLLVSLREGFVHNVRKPDPERENRRLTESASSTVKDIVENTRADGRRVFAGPVTKAAVRMPVYREATQDPPAVQHALLGVERSLRAVPETLKDLRVGSLAEAESANRALDRLGSQMDSSRRTLLAAARPSGLDLQA